jgi:hypothetical protein
VTLLTWLDEGFVLGRLAPTRNLYPVEDVGGYASSVAGRRRSLKILGHSCVVLVE